MLAVIGVEFWKNVKMQNGQPVYSGKYDQLHFDHYPVTVDVLHLAIHFRALGDFDGYYFIRVRHEDQIVHETSLSAVHGRDAGGGGSFDMVANVQGVTFPNPGQYIFEVMIEDTMLYGAPLTLTGSTNSQKRRRRH